MKGMELPTRPRGTSAGALASDTTSRPSAVTSSAASPPQWWGCRWRFLDLVTAVAIGMIAAGMASARQFERLELDSVISVPLLDRVFFAGGENKEEMDAFSARVGLVALRGSFSVASSNKLISTISVDIRDHEVVMLDFSETVYMDDSAALVIEQLIDTAVAEETACIVGGLKDMPASTLQALDVLQRVPESHFAATLDDAREIARSILIPLDDT